MLQATCKLVDSSQGAKTIRSLGHGTCAINPRAWPRSRRGDQEDSGWVSSTYSVMGSLLQVSSSRLSKRTCLTRSLQYDKVNSFHTEATWMSRSIPCDIRTQDEASTAWLSRQPLCRGCMKASIYHRRRQLGCLVFEFEDSQDVDVEPLKGSHSSLYFKGESVFQKSTIP